MTRTLRARLGAITGWAVALALSGPASGDDAISLTIVDGGQGAGETLVLAETSRELPPGSYSLQSDGPRPGPTAQVFRDRGKTCLAVILGPTPSPKTRRFELKPSEPGASDARGVELVPRGRRVGVLIDGKAVTEYVADDGPKPYFYPLIGPTGLSMTRGYPMKLIEGEKRDHPHHRSLWFTHGSVNKVDFWSELPGHGRIVETARTTVVGGPVVGVLRATDDWLAPDGKKVCEDERVVRIYPANKARVLDFEITLKASDGPVTFGDTKEGTFGLRVASSMDVTAQRGGENPQRGRARGQGRLGHALSLGGLHRPGRRENRRGGHPESPVELPISDDLACPRLRALRRQPVRMARFRSGEIGGFRPGRGRVDHVPVSDPPPRRRHGFGRPSRSVPVLRVPAEGDHRMMTVRLRSATPSIGRSWGSIGRSSNHCASKIKPHLGASGRSIGRSRS